MRRLVWALAAAAIGALALVPSTTARADDPPANEPLLSATADAYAMRIEYDLPVPAGTGTVGHVSATAQRSSSVETSHGLAASPSELDPVVGGKYADPQGSGHPVNTLPQVECHHPSANPTNVFRFPTGTNDSTTDVPATSYAYASCTSGPAVDVRAHAGDPTAPTPTEGEGAAVVESKGSIHPDHGVLRATASSSASGISLGGGVVRIGSVTASGESATAGTPGTARSVADVLLSDIQVAGVPTFSLAFTGSGVTLSSGAVSVPLEDAAAQAVITAANAAVAPTGCTLTVGRDPAAYPQGFLFARPQPDLGVRDDGSLAASYRGGLLVVCDIPDNPVAKATQFSPERFQALIGFVYTSVAAGDEVGGFGLADLGGQGGSLAALELDALVASAPSASGFGAGDASGGLASAPQLGSTKGAAGPAEDVTSVLTSFFEPLPAGARWALAVASIVLWAWLTHLAVTRLLGIGARNEGAAP